MTWRWVGLQERVLQKGHLQGALKTAGIKWTTRETVDDLCKTVVQSWRGVGTGEGGAAASGATAGKDKAEVGRKRTSEGEPGEMGGEKKMRSGGKESKEPDDACSPLAACGAGAGGSGVTGRAVVEAPGGGEGPSGRKSSPGAECIHEEEDDESSGASRPPERLSDAAGAGAQAPGGTHGVQAAGGSVVAACLSSSGRGEGEGRADTLGFQHLADVLCQAVPTLGAMTELVQNVKKKDVAFRKVQLSSNTSGGRHSKEELAAAIAECRPGGVTNEQGLLLWLVKVRIVIPCIDGACVPWVDRQQQRWGLFRCELLLLDVHQ